MCGYRESLRRWESPSSFLLLKVRRRGNSRLPGWENRFLAGNRPYPRLDHASETRRRRIPRDKLSRMANVEILWRRLDRPGHEAARLLPRGSGWELCGTAVFLQDGRSCRLSYQIDCDAEWRTVAAWVEGWVGEREVAVEI